MREQIFTYLKGLEANNNRDWYHAHKAEYQDAKEAFEQLIQELIYVIGKTDPSILRHNPKDLTFKLVRDTRFNHDKSPYQPAFRCHISSGGKLPVPVGYFLYLQPGNRSFFGGGLFADMFRDATSRVRDHILTRHEQFLEILNQPSFADCFELKGSALKNVPKGYPPDNPAAEYLKFKSWFIEDFFEDGLLESPSFVEYATERFLKMKPMNDFLNEGLKGFVMPSR